MEESYIVCQNIHEIITVLKSVIFTQPTIMDGVYATMTKQPKQRKINYIQTLNEIPDKMKCKEDILPTQDFNVT